ncbi:ABC transporter substrate-binding protein [uncultured Methanoregula sp.]|uniref:ABC transporter substrate-binding protein n=1 Tax=uncultured Methanoregula sp. TaxID=1005933 RepID=UPI002AAB931C|nr:ABC transporter substrate-binding protein [uncultured Methanoregula sp.]
MTEKKAIAILLLVVALLLVFSAGCQQPAKPPSPATIKVGLLYPVTGDITGKAGDSVKGVTLAIEEINAAGGIASLGGAKLVPVTGDTRGTPSDGARETERLIKNERVTAIVGAYQSTITIAATQVAEELETPFIDTGSSADVITERGFHYTFRFCPKSSEYSRVMVQFLPDLEKLAGYKVKRVALIHENSGFGSSNALELKKALNDDNLELATEVSYNARNVTNLNSEIAQVLASKPDAIFEVTYVNDSILIRQALARSGSTIPLLDSAGGTISPEYIQALGPLAEGTLTSSAYSRFTAGGKDFNDRFRARFGIDANEDIMYSYQAVWVLKDALERAGTVDHHAVRDALAATDMPRGPHMVLSYERLRFDASGQSEYSSILIVQIQNGSYVPVWPGKFATSKVQINQTGRP